MMTDISVLESEIMAPVNPNDVEQIRELLSFCAVVIGQMHKDIKTFIEPLRNTDKGDMLFYKVYVSLPEATVLRGKHFSELSSLGGKNITVVYDEAENPPILRMEILIAMLSTQSK